jgi:hypothetical protein
MPRPQVSVIKRQREQAKRERQERKAERKAQRKNEKGTGSDIDMIETPPEADPEVY